MKTIIATLVFLLPIITAQSQTAGTPDSTFGQNGAVLDSLTGGRPEGQCILVQQDKKILVSGVLSTGLLNVDNPAFIARYEEDGSPDLSFGDSGVMVDSAGFNFNGYKTIVLSGGKIIAAGTIRANLSSIYVRRFLTDGTPDSTFGTNSFTTVDYNGVVNTALNMALQSAGKIIVCGEIYSSTEGFNFYTVRFLANGSVDSTFGTNGKVEVNFGSNWDDRAYSIAVLDDDRFILAGTTYVTNQGNDIGLALFDSNGQPVNSFGTNGLAQIDLGRSENVSDILVYDNNSFLVAGSSASGPSDHNSYVAKITLSGTLDSTFGNTGLFLSKPNNKSATIFKLSVQADGKIIGAGRTLTSLNNDAVLIRLNTDGILDSSFATNGVYIKDYITMDDHFIGMTLDQDARILTAGKTSYQLLVCRFNNDTGTPTGILQQENFTLGIFPNPAKDFLRLSMQENASVEIVLCDVAGKVVQRIRTENDSRISLEGMKSGMYFLHVLSQEGRTRSVKVMIQE